MRGNKTTSRRSEKQASQTSQPESLSKQVEHLQLLVITPSYSVVPGSSIDRKWSVASCEICLVFLSPRCKCHDCTKNNSQTSTDKI